MTPQMRILDAAELREAYDTFFASILLGPSTDASWPRAEGLYAAGRTLGVREDGALVATAAAFPSRMAVPGGAAVPMAAVTRVGVRADRTRRGLLTAMIREQLRDVAERGEVVASLRASQARIYGRFGYGVATRARGLRIRRTGAGWRDEAPRGGTVRLVPRAEAQAVLSAVHERIALRRPGGMTRSPGWWANTLGRDLEGDGNLIVAVHAGSHGDDGFAVARPGTGEDWERRPLVVDDLHAVDLTAAAELWRFLLDVDLAGAVEGHLRPLDEALELLLADRRDCVVTATGDEAWLRLVDIPAALATRTFRAGLADPVLVGVHDPLLPANTGVYRIGDGPAARVEAPAQLECDVAGLAMAYLADQAPSALAATGWWRVREPAALARADLLFGTPVAPWCGTFF